MPGNHNQNQNRNRNRNRNRRGRDDVEVLHGNLPVADMLGHDILLTTVSDQLNLLGQTFRPIFTGRVVEVTDGYITLDPVTIKISTAPFHRFPTPLSFPIERISNFVPFDPEQRFPIP